ncbi:hypothetical protein ACFQOY_13510 [Enterococcus alcedinis]|uniref:hypothetical protein n=1 Tax=Enterococcus alcedinis TaxID=1274384 RepID=UPI00361D9B08
MEDNQQSLAQTDFPDAYLMGKESYKAEIEQWITDTELELEDLYLRKKFSKQTSELCLTYTKH